MISGKVTFDVIVDRWGVVTSVSENAPAQSELADERLVQGQRLLAAEAKDCLGEWRFDLATGDRKITVVFDFGFSGTIRETNPRTTVKADFTGSSVRVFITTDARPSGPVPSTP